MLMTAISAQGRSTSVFAGRFHRGSGSGSGATVEGMMLNSEKKECFEFRTKILQGRICTVSFSGLVSENRAQLEQKVG
jgi:tRNA A37 threonylcarbamoyltransferase TsaD